MAIKLAPADIFRALSLLSRLPVPADGQRSAQSTWAFPVAGAIVGALAGLAGELAYALGLPAALSAGLALATLVIITGAMHEDGLADSADGLWGGYERARRLEIMKDSRIGSYGVLALVLSLLLRWSALDTLLDAQGGLVWLMAGIAALSRAPMAVMMALVPNARGTGLSASQGTVGRDTALAGCLVAAALALVTLGPVPALAASAAVGATALAATAIAKAKIGGQTGDILGATQQLSEIAGLAALTLFL